MEKLITSHVGERPASTEHTGRLILLTSGTTGNPKGAKHSGGGATELQAMQKKLQAAGFSAMPMKEK